MTVTDGRIEVVYGPQNRRMIEDALGVVESTQPADRQVRKAAENVLRRFPPIVIEVVRNGR